ncbi:MAG: hypothetical protein AAFX50_24535, partial [Acidobacteriota bacterium]
NVAEAVAALDPSCYDLGQVQADLEQMLDELGVDPDFQTVLWATENLEPPVNDATLLVRSNGDPDFLVPRLLRPDALRDGAMLFLVDFDCEVYTTNLRVVTEPIEQDGVVAPLVSLVPGSVPFADQCLYVDAEVGIHVVETCGAEPAESVTISLQAQGAELDILRLEDGGGRTVFSQVAPVDGLLYTVDIDTSELDDGVHSYRAAATNASGRTAVRDMVVPVDRSAPTLTIEAPADGAQVCASSAPDGTPFFEIAFGARDAFEAGLPQQRPIAWPPGPGTDLDPLQVGLRLGAEPLSVPQELIAVPGAFVEAGPITVGLERVPGAVTTDFSLEVVGLGGHRVCASRSFSVDAVADAVVVDGPVFFSPNGDG